MFDITNCHSGPLFCIGSYNTNCSIWWAKLCSKERTWRYSILMVPICTPLMIWLRIDLLSYWTDLAKNPNSDIKGQIILLLYYWIPRHYGIWMDVITGYYKLWMRNHVVDLVSDSRKRKNHLNSGIVKRLKRGQINLRCNKKMFHLMVMVRIMIWSDKLILIIWAFIEVEDLSLTLNIQNLDLTCPICYGSKALEDTLKYCNHCSEYLIY